MNDDMVDQITDVLADCYRNGCEIIHAPTAARYAAERVIAELHLTTETVHVEGEWGFGARDEVRIRGVLKG